MPLTSMTGFLLQRAGTMLLAEAERALELRGTRARYFYVLAALDGSPGLSQRDLAEIIGLDAGILGSLVDEMEAEGHVARIRSATDKRRYVLNITAAGRDALGVLMADMQQIEDRFLHNLSPHEAGELRSYLERALAGRWPGAADCPPDSEG